MTPSFSTPTSAIDPEANGTSHAPPRRTDNQRWGLERARVTDLGSATSLGWTRAVSGVGQYESKTSLDAHANRPVVSLEPIQEWEGYVTEIGVNLFTARLADITAGKSTEDETADFAISDLSDDDLSLLKEGSVFRWVIGYQRTKSGQKTRASQIVFRRLPAWNKRDLDIARRKAQSLSAELAWD